MQDIKGAKVKKIRLETYMAIVFYLSIAFSFYIKGDFINTGLVLGIGTVVISLLYSITNQQENPLIKKLKELF